MGSISVKQNPGNPEKAQRLCGLQGIMSQKNFGHGL